MTLHPDIAAYNGRQTDAERGICNVLARAIEHGLPQAAGRIRHAHPVCFLDDNPTVGYSKLKHCVRLLFWSGQSFETPGLVTEGRFKAAEARYMSADEVDATLLACWLAEAREVQWDYRNIARRKGNLVRLK